MSLRDLHALFIVLVEHADQLFDVLDAVPLDDAAFCELTPKGVRNGRSLMVSNCRRYAAPAPLAALRPSRKQTAYPAAPRLRRSRAHHARPTSRA
jgi:hypothetical protein